GQHRYRRERLVYVTPEAGPLRAIALHDVEVVEIAPVELRDDEHHRRDSIAYRGVDGMEPGIGVPRSRRRNVGGRPDGDEPVQVRHGGQTQARIHAIPRELSRV